VLGQGTSRVIAAMDADMEEFLILFNQETENLELQVLHNKTVRVSSCAGTVGDDLGERGVSLLRLRLKRSIRAWMNRSFKKPHLLRCRRWTPALPSTSTCSTRRHVTWSWQFSKTEPLSSPPQRRYVWWRRLWKLLLLFVVVFCC